MRAAVALGVALAWVGAAMAGDDRPPPGAIPGWFDPATGRFEPLAAAPAPEEKTPASAGAAYATGVYVLALNYGSVAQFKVEPTDTLQCGVTVTVTWMEGPPGRQWPVTQQFDDGWNVAWEKRPAQRRISIVMPTRTVSAKAPKVGRRIGCIIWSVGGSSKTFADLSLERRSTRAAYGPNFNDPVTLAWQ